MILISQRTDYAPVLRMRKGETICEEINLTPLLNERDDTISSVSWESDNTDITATANSNDDYSATVELTADAESCSNVTLEATTSNGQTLKAVIRVYAREMQRCDHWDDYGH